MSQRLKTEIKQNKPFESLEAEAFLNVLRTADVLMRGVAETLKTSELSSTQYNALRILRGAGKAGLACSEVAERMVNKDPDITRLMDRLEQRGLVTRARDGHDRRIVTAKTTAKALQILAALDAPVEELHQRQLGKLGSENLQRLVALLERARHQ
jgi:DNA-binding MarR family transcriptional regulator